MVRGWSTDAVPIAASIRRSRQLRLFVGAKLFDSTTTAIGLMSAPFVVEGNPWLRMVISHLGILPGLILATLVVLGLVVIATELGVHLGQRFVRAAWVPSTIRRVGYGTLTFVFIAAGLNNVLVIGWSHSL